MNKKIIYIVLLILVFMAIIFIFNENKDDTVSTDENYDTSYYVEANGNLFVKVAKMIDNICNYIINFVLDGIESVFSIILDN